MRSRYLIYPEAIEKINSTRLAERVEEIKRTEDGFPFFGGVTYEDDVVFAVQELKDKGYLKTLPIEEKTFYTQALENAFKNQDDSFWIIKRNGNDLKEPIDLEDFLLMTGWLSHFVLKPDEIWDYKKFGFSSITDFTGSLGAFIQQSNRLDFMRGYRWKIQLPDGRILHNEITGSEHLDLRIYQTDITPDETIDPIGNHVLYRPELDADRKLVAAYHSTEPSLLVALLKYIEQHNIHPEILKDNRRGLIEWTKSLGQTIGLATECLFSSWDGGLDSPMTLFWGFDLPIPALNENYTTQQQTNDGLSTDSQGYYGIYTGPNEELIFAYEGGRNGIKPQKKVSASFQPQEVDHLFKGLFYQSAKGLGRTPVRKLSDILEYRYSEKFEQDRKDRK